MEPFQNSKELIACSISMFKIFNRVGEANREEEAWDKLNALWSREVARWDQERVLWDQKEKRLLDQIFQLQTLVTQLSLRTPHQQTPQLLQAQPQQSPPQQPEQNPKVQNPQQQAPPEVQPELNVSTKGDTPSEERQAAATATRQQANSSSSSPSSTAPGRQTSVLEEASRFMPPEPQPYQPVPPEEFAPLEVSGNRSHRFGPSLN